MIREVALKNAAHETANAMQEDTSRLNFERDFASRGGGDVSKELKVDFEDAFLTAEVKIGGGTDEEKNNEKGKAEMNERNKSMNAKMVKSSVMLSHAQGSRGGRPTSHVRRL